MKCDFCEREARFVVHCDAEIHFVCLLHLEEGFGEFPYEKVGDSPLVRSAFNEAERVLEELLAGKVVRLIHLKHPEVHWAKFDREKGVIEKVVDSRTGETFGPLEFRKFQDYYELLGRAIASGWIAVVTNIQPEAILGGER